MRMTTRGLGLLLAVACAACGGPGGEGGNGGAAGLGGGAGTGGSGGTGGTGGSAGTGGTIPDGTLCEVVCDRMVGCEAEEEGVEPDPLERADCVRRCEASGYEPAHPDACKACVATATCFAAEEFCVQSGPCAAAMYDLTLRGTGFEGADGTVARVLLVDESEGSWPVASVEATLEGGSFVASMPSSMWHGWPYSAFVAIDTDGDGVCSVEGTDLVVQVDLGVIEGDVDRDVGPPTAGGGVCTDEHDPIPSLLVEGSGFAGMDGRFVVFGLDYGDGYIEEAAAPVIDGAFAFRWEWVDSAPGLRLGWVIDDGDWLCESDDDFGGWVQLPSLDGGLTVSLTPGDSRGGYCAHLDDMGRDLTLQGSGFDGPEGAMVAGFLLDENGAPVDWSEGTLTGGGFELVWPRAAAEGASYRAAIYVDVDEDYACNEGDPAYFVEIGAVGEDAVRSVQAAELQNDPAACEWIDSIDW